MMESGASAAEAPKAPSRKAMWAIIAVIVAIAVAASGTVWYLASAPQYAKFSLVALDFAYDQTANPDIHPLHHAKAGQPIWVVFSNEGTNDHEFLLYQNKDAALTSANAALALAQAHNPGWATDSDIANATLDEYDTLHDTWDNLTRYNDVDRDVAPDATTNLLFVINEPGTYFFVCHQVDHTTDPANWMVHQGDGMWGTLIVDP